MAIKAIINNTEKEIEQIKNSDEQDIDYVYSRVGEKEAEGEPTVSIESIGGELTNYRIYGQTVDGESVGDLVTSGEHAGEYKVPVTVEGKNLLPNTATSRTINGVTFTVNEDGSVTCNGTASDAAWFVLNKSFDIYAPDGRIASIGNNGSTSTFYMNISYVGNATSSLNFSRTIHQNVYVQLVIAAGYTCNNLTFYPMIRKADIQDDTYEPYQAPIDTNIYLPEPIRKVGNETEYIDYAEQKQHIVRKNLLLYSVKSKTINGVTFRVNNDGSVTCNGTAKNNTWFTLLKNCSIFGECILSGSPFNGSSSRYLIQAYYNNDSVVADYGAGTILNFNNPFTVEIRIASGFTCRNLTFYPMIRKANIEDDTYEPYITNTELDVTLPALSTIKGTNTLSVNTTIQPSNIYIKDNFDYKRIFTATRAIEGELPLNYRNIEDNDSTLKNYRIYGQTENGESVGDLETTGEHAGEYKVPVTVEGKNLLPNTATSRTIDGLTFTVNSDGSVTCNGRRESTSTFFTIGSITTSGEIILSGCPRGGSSTSFAMRAYSATISNPMIYYDIGDSCRLNTPDTYSIDIRIQSGYTCDNLTFYPMIRRAEIADGTYEPYQPPITTNLYLPEQICKVGDEAEYIDYVEQKQHFVGGTSVDVTLPALPTIAGTNTISVGTQVQPSKVYLKGKLKRTIYG